jgi:hypothetical protein
MAASNMPALAKSICKLAVVDLAAAAECERSEATFHAWLQQTLSLGHIQLLYCSPLYKAFLTRRFTRQLELAQATPGNRAESIRVLLESAELGSLEHAALLLVQSLEERTKPVIEKLRLLWCTPRPAEILAQWKVKDWEAFIIFLEGVCTKDWERLDSTSVKHVFATMRGMHVAPKDIPNGVLQSLYDEYLKIHDSKNKVLNQCFDEQLQFRISRATAVTAAPDAAPPPVPDFDCSDADALVVAKDMFQIWSVSLGTKKNLAHA